MKTFINLYIANLKEYARDRMAVFWTMAFPILFILLFGLIFSGSIGDLNFNVGLVAGDSDPASAGVVLAFKSVPIFKVHESRDLEAERAALQRGERDMVIVVPDNLSQSIAEGKASNIEVYYDPSATTTAQAGLSIVREVLNATERRIHQTTPLFTIQSKQIQTKPLRQIDFIVPGMLAMSLMQLGLFATAQPLVALREQGVLRRLGATPLPRSTVLASQIAFRLTVGMAQAVIILGLGNLVFKVQIGDNLPLLALIVALGALLFIAIGFAIAGLANSEESAAGIGQMVNLPMMFLSGVFFPLSFLPSFIQPIASALPLTYVIDALRQVMVGSAPTNPMGTNLLLMVAWLAASAVLAVKLFKWES